MGHQEIPMGKTLSKPRWPVHPWCRAQGERPEGVGRLGSAFWSTPVWKGLVRTPLEEHLWQLSSSEQLKRWPGSSLCSTRSAAEGSREEPGASARVSTFVLPRPCRTLPCGHRALGAGSGAGRRNAGEEKVAPSAGGWRERGHCQSSREQRYGAEGQSHQRINFLITLMLWTLLMSE